MSWNPTKQRIEKKSNKRIASGIAHALRHHNAEMKNYRTYVIDSGYAVVGMVASAKLEVRFTKNWGYNGHSIQAIA